MKHCPNFSDVALGKKMLYYCGEYGDDFKSLVLTGV
jgi:hypothetical protein